MFISNWDKERLLRGRLKIDELEWDIRYLKRAEENRVALHEKVDLLLDYLGLELVKQPSIKKIVKK